MVYSIKAGMAKVLVVDDDVDLLASVKLSLQMHGFDVLALGTANGIYNEIRCFKPHVILLDIMICENDGRIVCQKIKTESYYRNVPVILYSSYTDLLKAYMLYRADAYVEKPFDIDFLVNKINSVLNNSSVRA